MSSPGPDLASREDLEALIRAFYARAFADPLIGPVFTDVAHMDLESHLPTMVDFWDTVLFNTGAYQGNALRLHRRLHQRVPLTAEHFARWLALWEATVRDHHRGPTAERAEREAARIAASLQRHLAGQSGSQHVTLAQRPADTSTPAESHAHRPAVACGDDAFSAPPP